MNLLPEWLVVHVVQGLLGEIYPSIRAIALDFDEAQRFLRIVYYLDRAPLDVDIESAETVATNISASSGIDKVRKIDISCEHSCALIRDLNPYTGFIYCRREYPFD